MTITKILILSANPKDTRMLWEKAKPVLLKVTDWLGQAIAQYCSVG